MTNEWGEVLRGQRTLILRRHLYLEINLSVLQKSIKTGHLESLARNDVFCFSKPTTCCCLGAPIVGLSIRLLPDDPCPSEQVKASCWVFFLTNLLEIWPRLTIPYPFKISNPHNLWAYNTLFKGLSVRMVCHVVWTSGVPCNSWELFNF